MSDSKLLAIKAPAFISRVGRPKETRFKGVSDYYQSKQKRRINVDVFFQRYNPQKKIRIEREEEVDPLW